MGKEYTVNSLLFTFLQCHVMSPNMTMCFYFQFWNFQLWIFVLNMSIQTEAYVYHVSPVHSGPAVQVCIPLPSTLYQKHCDYRNWPINLTESTNFYFIYFTVVECVFLLP